MWKALLPMVAVSMVFSACNCGGGGGVAAGVHDTFPRDGNTTVSTDTDVVIEFSGPMQQQGVEVTFTPPVIAFGHYWVGNTLTLVRGFTNGLQPSTPYAVTVSGSPEVGAPVNHTFSFTTRAEPADQSSPTFTSSPAEGATDVAPMTPVVLTFSEPMKPDSVTVWPSRGSLGKRTWNATFDRLEIAPPAGGFLPGSVNELNISGSDRWFNGFASRTLTFSVPEPVPALAVLGMSPTPGSTVVPQYGRISLSFSRDMEPDSTVAAITLTPSNGCSAGQSEWIHPRMYRCRPMNTLAIGTEYTLTVGTGAKDVAGEALSAPYVATFTAAAVTETTAPTIVSTVPAEGAVGVPEDAPLVINFSESMDRGTTEQEFRFLSNGSEGRLSWNPESTQLTFTPRTAYNPGLTVQWTADFSEDYSGNYIYEYTTAREYQVMGEGTGMELSVREVGSVTLGSLGGGSAELADLMVGDDARNQALQSFLSFGLQELASEGWTAVGVRQAFLLLPRVGCDGDVGLLGSTLLVEGVDRGEAFDAAELSSAAVGEAVSVSNVCAGPDWLYIDVTAKVAADLAARAANGGLSHFRLRFPQGSNGDGQADRLVITSQLQLFTEPQLQVIYDYIPAG